MTGFRRSPQGHHPAGQPDLTVNIISSWATSRKRSRSLAKRPRRHLIGDDRGGCGPCAYRRVADCRPRGGAAADAGGWHGVGIDQRGNRQVDTRRRPDFRQRRRRAQNSYRLDGASNTDPYYQENQSFPFPDALQEFVSRRELQRGAWQQCGRGRERRHALGHEQLPRWRVRVPSRSPFNSKGFFAAEKDFLKRNQYGGFAGGPIRRNSTFFFAGWQRTRITNRASELIRFVPTAAQRRGDFSSCVPACPQLYNPPTGLPFANNQIPARCVDPAAVKVFAALPDIRQPRMAKSQFLEVPTRLNQFIAKVDQQLGTNNQFTVRYFLDDFNNASQFVPENILSYIGPSLESDPRSQSIVDGVEADAQLDAAQRVHIRLQPPPYGATAASGGSVYSGFRHPASLLPEISSVSEIERGRLFQLRRQPRSVIPARRVPVQQQDELDQRTTRHPVRRRVRIPALGDLQRLPSRRPLHLQRPVHSCTGRGQRRACARGFPARQAANCSTTAPASTRTIETSISRISSRTI